MTDFDRYGQLEQFLPKKKDAVCEYCGGTGETPEDARCPNCYGTGHITEAEFDDVQDEYE